jgi:hypothetical protein
LSRVDARARATYVRKLARGPWQQLERKPLSLEERRWPDSLGNFVEAWVNNVVSVQVYLRDTPWGFVRHLGVRRHDGAELAGWDLLERVKNEVVGQDSIALEVYPPARDVVDLAPMRHLFVVPESFPVPLTIKGPWR